MDREPGLKWLFLDLNSYFASVEQQERPHLRGKPVAVVPMETDHTCAIAASYEAKAYGIKTGTMIRDAKKMCPNLTCVLARHDKYVEYHHKIVDEIALHTPINKIWSIDELSSRLPPRGGAWRRLQRSRCGSSGGYASMSGPRSPARSGLRRTRCWRKSQAI